jgi:alpha-glucosidase (family GH31 glycosyl hydrolase)
LEEENNVFKVTLSETLVFLRGGTIVATFEKVGGSAQETFSQPIVLWVAEDEEGKAEGDVYFDDGLSYAYTQGEFVLRHFLYGNGVITSRGEISTVPENVKEVIVSKIIVFGKDVKTINVGQKLVDDFEIKI